MNAHPYITTATDLGSALTMRPRRRSVSDIVRNVFEAECGPIPSGVLGRRANIHLRQCGIWAMSELNCTDAEIKREYGVSEFHIIHSVEAVTRRRMGDAVYRKLTAAVLAEVENA